MRKVTVFCLFLAFVVLAGISANAGKSLTDRPLDSKATCSEPLDVSHTKCDKRICPAVLDGCPRVLCDTDGGICCYQCPGSPTFQCL